MWRLSVFIVCLFVKFSLQLQECEISSGLTRNLDLAEGEMPVLTAQDACKEGLISWHYPNGKLGIHFPRSLAGNDVGRKAIKVCLRGDIGEGLTGVRETRIDRRGTECSYKMELPASDVYTCSRPSRSADGITLTLLSEDSLSYYLKVIHYKVEVVDKKRGRKNSRKEKRTRDPARLAVELSERPKNNN